MADTFARQLARSGGGVAGNYHATRRARSRVEFIARLAVVVEEADESVLWLEQMHAAGIASGEPLDWLVDEARQLRAIFARSLATAKKNYALQKASTPPRRERK